MIESSFDLTKTSALHLVRSSTIHLYAVYIVLYIIDAWDSEYSNMRHFDFKDES